MKSFKHYLTEAEIAVQPAPTGEYDAIDSAESYKAWLQKSAAEEGLTPAQSAELLTMLVVEPDGSIDMDATMVKTMKAFVDLLPQLVEMFSDWLGILEKAKLDPAQWSTYTPEEQKSIDSAIAEAKAQLPVMKAELQKAQTQMPELDKAMADRKAAGTNTIVPSKPPAPMEELGRIKELAGVHDEDVSFNGVTQHANGDMSYNQGPLSMRKNKDGSSDMSATIGDTTARVQQNPLGVKTMTAQGPDADAINSVDASAERKGVDPKKFAKFQQRTLAPTSEALNAMLRIAGLK